VNVPASVLVAASYLGSGFLIIAACEAGYDGRWLINRAWTPERIGFYCGLSYAIGNLVALLGDLLIERRFVGRFLEFPEDRLEANVTSGRRRWREWLFRDYCRPLPDDLQSRIVSRARIDQVPESGRELFLHAAANVAESRASARRLETSLEMARACRTMCLGLTIVAAILATGLFSHGYSGRWRQREWRKFGYCAWALCESSFMLVRYLKFFKRHAVQVFAAYGELQDGGG